MLAGKLLQYIFGSGVLTGFSLFRFRVELHFFEKNFAQLSWRIHIEFFTGEFKNILFKLSQIIFEVFTFLFKPVFIQ